MLIFPKLTNAQEHHMQICCGNSKQNQTDRNVIIPLSKLLILLHLLFQSSVTEYIVVDTFKVRVRALVFV
jgi:hypothetical protein